jgi:DNA invertase Pin-like site-specific DNA recombinase
MRVPSQDRSFMMQARKAPVSCVGRLKAIYVRTSVADADGAAQLHQLRQAAKARGWRDFSEYIDIGQSGARTSRPALSALRAACKRGEIDDVMTTALDRLGRNLRDLLLLLDELAACGCAVISLREGIDLSTPTGKLMTAIFGALAEFERGLIRQRIQNGIDKVRATGKSRSGRPLGRPKRVVDVQRVLALRAAGRSWRAIAIALKTPRRTLERACAGVAQNPSPESPEPHARKTDRSAGWREI